MSSAPDSHYIKMKILATLIGVAILRGVSGETGQPELTTLEDRPIREEGNVGKGRETPEVFLQLKYDKGELDRIYLTQFRKEKRVWSPSVNVETHLCADLCHAGLGGEVCGSTCRQLLPIGLKSALAEANTTEESYGQPRTAVCPALCNNYLGQPLCQCPNEDKTRQVDWTAVCNAFCQDGYVLNGCPPCTTEPQLTVAVPRASFRALGTAQGWQSWCNVQCVQGHGGAACNCDRTPFT